MQPSSDKYYITNINLIVINKNDNYIQDDILNKSWLFWE